jgi:hypothetical protein
MLFLQPLFKLGSIERKRARYGYADDICLITAGCTLEENIAVLQQDFQLVATWGRAEGLTFDIGKTELLHLTRRTRDGNPAARLSVGEGQNEHVVAYPC